MNSYTLSHLSDGILLRDLAGLVARDRLTTAQLLAHLAEMDTRRLYAPAGYPSMYAYCVRELRFSEEAAYKRIHAARTARAFPEIFTALAAGRLHMSAVILLAPHLTEETAHDLLEAATHRSKCEIEKLLAERSPRPELPSRIEPLTLSPSQVLLTDEHAPGRVAETIPPQAETPPFRHKVAPLGTGRFGIQFTIDESTKEKLHYAEALFSHQIRPGDLAGLFDRALDALIRAGEKRTFAQADRPRQPGRRSTRSTRHVPDEVKRAVWQRDHGQCTFVSDNGRRCAARDRLEFDHVVPVARGGQASVENLRLRCRAHNQYEAERTFGVDFMRRKRDQSRRAAEQQREEAAREKAYEVIPWLRELQVSPAVARQAAEHCVAAADSPIEERVRLALSYLGSRIARPRGFDPAATAPGAGISSTIPSTSCSSAPP